jgi:membrane protein DedA with SNARE-associated domain
VTDAVLVASVTSRVTDAITSAIGDHGLYAVFLLMLVDAVLPAASELVMVYAGAVAAGAFAGQHVVVFGERISSGSAAFLAMTLAGTVGYTLGSIGGWAIGLYGGRPYLERHGRWLHITPAKLDRAERWFDRFDDAAAFVGRITPVARSFISIPAGVFRMPLGRYTALTFVGSTLWCLAFAGVGWALGSRWEDFHHGFRFVDYLVAGVIAVAVAYLVARRVRRRRPQEGLVVSGRDE